MSALRLAHRQDPVVSDEKELADKALDLFLYVPVGIAYEVADAIPRLARRGRGQVGLARLVGNAAANRGQSELHKLAGTAFSVIGGLLDEEPTTNAGPAGSNASVPAGYDDMTAAEVVAALDGCSPAQLRAVSARERSGKNRITVLRRVDELLDRS